MRRLIYIPIIHGEIDMGSLSDRLKEEYIAKFGEDKWKEYLNVADELWNEIGRRLERLNLDYKKVKLFQDGLPKSGKEMDIVRELAEKGSANYKLLLNLIEKGAQIIGTEDPQLLIKEYNHVKDIVKETSIEDGKERLEKYREIGSLLLSERDGYIGRRISESLGQGETGILFIGIAHKVDKTLPEDIKVEYLT
ncbi:MAG: hypothetical protein HZB81_03950 [Deltaproteobacteria bacterium]|nr:hypothetical protein [Deltaproteobacteria bacterium]